MACAVAVFFVLNYILLLLFDKELPPEKLDRKVLQCQIDW